MFEIMLATSWCYSSCGVSCVAVDNYGSFGDDNTSNEDDDDENYYESGAPQVTFPDSNSDYPEFGVPNIGSLISVSSQI